MRFAIVYSKTNPAGVNIVGEFKKIAFAPQIPIIELKGKEEIYQDFDVSNYPELSGIDFIVFASKHKSVKGTPSLSMHAPGNWRGADFGGVPGKICPTSAFVLKFLFQKLSLLLEENPNIKETYALTMEVTHHGPLIDIPCCFVELGSTLEQWNDKPAANLLAKLIHSLTLFEPKSKTNEWLATIGIGGPHYCPNFNPIQLNSKYAIGHIIPSYSMPLTESMLMEAEKKTKEQISCAIIDWKSFDSESRQNTLSTLEKHSLKIKKTSEIEK
jgi:D-aminoacyl-tRNA deacylase